MNEQWYRYLADQGAVLGADGVQHFGDPPGEARQASAATVLCDLGHFGLIRAAGPDAVEFLQGQLTNDVRRVDQRHSQLTAYCNPKGRMLAVMRLLRLGEDLVLMLPRSLCATIVRRLSMFVLRAQLSLEDASDEWVRFGVSGPEAEALLADQGLTPPEEVDQASAGDGSVAIRVPGRSARFIVCMRPEQAPALWAGIRARARPVGADAWALLDILAGVPNVYPETAEAFVAQMANLELIGGVSFNKGCYTGQEVIARMHYLGKPSRRMFRFRLAAPPPRAGSEIVAEQDGQPQTIGQVVDARASGEGDTAGLAVLQLQGLDAHALHVADRAEVPLTIEPLPYPVGADEPVS